VSRRGALIAAGAGLAVAGAAAALDTRRRLRALAEAPDPYTDEELGPLRGEQGFVDTHDGGRLYFVDAGQGPTVVLAHGYTATSQFWCLTQPDLVARGHRVVAYDERGHGHSDAGRAGFGVELLGRDLATVLTELDLTDVVVAGHSMGGVAVQSLLVDHPDVAKERVRHAVICCSLARSRRGARLLTRLLGRERVHKANPPDALGDLLALQIFGRGTPPASLVRLARRLGDSQDPAHMAALARTLGRFDLRPGLRDVPVDVTVVAAGRDKITPPVLSHELATAMAGCEERWFPQAGHMLPWEHPLEFTDILAGAASAPGPETTPEP